MRVWGFPGRPMRWAGETGRSGRVIVIPMLRFFLTYLFFLGGLLLGELTQEETLQACRRHLASSEASERREAVLVLSKYEDPEVPGLLAQALGDRDASVRMAALVSLAENPAYVRQESAGVLACLQDSEVEIRRLASSLLPSCLGIHVSGRVTVAPGARVTSGSGQGEEGEAFLALALGDEDREVRKNALKATPFFAGSLPLAVVSPFLQEESPEEIALAVPLVVRANAPVSQRLAALRPLLSHPSPELRELLAKMLGEMPASWPVLEELSRDDVASVRGEALLSWCRLAPEEQRGALAEEVGEFLESREGAGISATLLRRLLHALEEFSPEGAEAAVASLLAREFPQESREELWLQVLRHPEWQKTLAISTVADALATQGNVPSLRRVLLSLLRKKAGEMTREDLRRLQRSPQVEARQCVLELLRSLPRELREEAVMGALLDEDISLRAKALEVLSSLRPEGWEELLVATLDDPSPVLQMAAAQGLSRSGTLFPASREALSRWLPQCPEGELKKRLTQRLQRK